MRHTSGEWVRIPASACEKVASDLGLGSVFAGYSGFLHYLQPASHELATIGINVTKNEIPIPILQEREEASLMNATFYSVPSLHSGT